MEASTFNQHRDILTYSGGPSSQDQQQLSETLSLSEENAVKSERDVRDRSKRRTSDAFKSRDTE
jgi:hypothetical protein